MLAERAAARPFNFADVVAPMPLGFRRIAQGDEIVAGGRRWRVEIGHGHAPEQATLWGVGHDLVLAGDQILPGHHPEPRGLRHRARRRPGRRLARLLRPAGARSPTRAHLALPGHRRPFRGLPARLAELVAHQRGGARRGCARTSRRRGGRASASTPLYGRRDRRRRSTGWRSAEAVGHLNHLRRARRGGAAARAGRRLALAGAAKWGLTARRDRGRRRANRASEAGGPDGGEGARHGRARSDSVTDVAEHQRTFEAFIRFWVYVFGAAVAVLIFLAIFNS